MRKHKLNLAIVWAAGFCVAFSIGLYIFWSVYPSRPLIKQEPTPFKLVDGINVAPQGGAISYDYNYCKFTDLQAVVDKKFIDTKSGLIFQSTDTSTVLEKGCGHVHREISIPRTLPPSEYTLDITATYYVNPVQGDEVVHNHTEPFTVVRSAEGAYGDSTNGGITPQ